MARRCWVLTGPASSTGSPMTFMMRPSVSSPTGTAIGSPVSMTSWPRTRPSVDVHGDGADRVLAEMLGDLEHEPVAVVLGLERIQDRRQVAVELHVDDGAGHLGDAAGDALDVGLAVLLCHGLALSIFGHSASAPEMISISSLVICAWRVRL